MPLPIDLNADLGESYGAWRMGDDAALMPFISSCNIACGFHAGDPRIMDHTVRLALAAGVHIGAHPSLPDIQGFGRRDMAISADEAHALVLYQIGALAAFCKARGARLHHVKPHGALYNMAARDPLLAAAIAQAVADFDRELILVGLANSASIVAGRAAGLSVWQEAFADRRYTANGQLQPRNQPGAVIVDVEQAVQQALDIARHGAVTSAEGERLTLQADTICLHGDSAHALALAARVRQEIDALSAGQVL
ncbi:MAG: 5-oxoprolinase subunit PxpA [Nevskiales bacterium]